MKSQIVDLDFLMQDDIWPYLLINDSNDLQHILTSDQVPAAINNGKIAAQIVRNQFPHQTIQEIIAGSNLKISYSNEPEKVFNRYRRATYEKHPPEVTIYLKSINNLKNLAIIYNIDELASRKMIIDVMLAHELYHHLQKQLLPQARSQYRRVWRQLGPVKIHRFIPSLNEITAHVFSRELCQIKTSPFILDLLTLHRSEERLMKLIDKAIELSKRISKKEEMYSNEAV